jgi:hypothetical protein
VPWRVETKNMGNTKKTIGKPQNLYIYMWINFRGNGENIKYSQEFDHSKVENIWIMLWTLDNNEDYGTLYGKLTIQRWRICG